MTSSIAFDASDLVALVQRAQRAPAIVKDEGKQAMDVTSGWVLHDAQANLQQVGAIDSRKLIGSMDRAVDDLSWDVFSDEPYGIVVEEGRGANKPMPPPGSLDGWLERHGLPENLDFVIRRAIAREGTDARPFLVPALDRNERRIEGQLQVAVLRMVTRVMAA